LKTTANKRVRELKKTIKEMKKAMEKMIPEENFNQVVKEKVSEKIKEWWRGGRKKNDEALKTKETEETKETVSPEYFPDADKVLTLGDDDDDDDDSDDDGDDDDDNDELDDDDIDNNIDIEYCSVCNVKMNPDDDKHYCDTRDGWFCPDCFPGICDDDLCDGCQTTQENMD
jgi:hypothetical protein